MPQDKLVKLNRLKVEKEALGNFLLITHELDRRVIEGTYPEEAMYEEIKHLLQLPAVDPQLHAARRAAWELPRELRLHALMHIALLTKKPKDISDACTCAELLKTTEAYDYMMRLYYQLGCGVEHEPIKRFLCENVNGKEMCEKLNHNYIGRKVFGYEEPDCSNATAWQAECDAALQLDQHPLFDDYLLKLLEATTLIVATTLTDLAKMKQTAAALCDKISGYYAKAKALCLRHRFDELRDKISEDWHSLKHSTHYGFRPAKMLEIMLAASELFKHTREPRDLSTVYGLISGLESEFPFGLFTYNNLPAIAEFHTDFWQTIATGVEPTEDLATTGGNLFMKLQGAPRANAESILLFHPDSWLNIYLQPYFHFNDTTCDNDHPVFDPERHNYSISQKIAAYLVMAEDWPGDACKRDHLERAYNYALDLPDSYYKVLVLCDIYELKIRFGLDKKSKRA